MVTKDSLRVGVGWYGVLTYGLLILVGMMGSYPGSGNQDMLHYISVAGTIAWLTIGGLVLVCQLEDYRSPAYFIVSTLFLAIWLIMLAIKFAAPDVYLTAFERFAAQNFMYLFPVVLMIDMFYTVHLVMEQIDAGK